MSEITEAQAYEAVYTRWKSQWETLRPEVPYCFENEKFKEPTQPGLAWARVTLRPTDASQYTLGGLGGSLWMRSANVWVQLYVPRDGGMALVASLVDDVRKVFEGQSFGGLDPAGGTRSVTGVSDGRWYEVAVISPVTYYDKH